MTDQEDVISELRNEAQKLRMLTDEAVIAGLTSVLDLWRGEQGTVTAAARELSRHTGQSQSMLRFGLDRMVASHTKDTLKQWLFDARREAGCGGRERMQTRSGDIPAGPELMVQVLAGNIAGLAIPATIEAMLARSAVLLKPASGDPVIPRMLKETMDSGAPELGRAMGVQSWHGGKDAREESILNAADFVVATGGEALDTALPAKLTTPYLIYGPRITVAVVGEGWTGAPPVWWEEVVREIVLWDQRGCLSPRVLLVMGNTKEFARRLAAEFERREKRWPARPLSWGAAAEVHAFRARFLMGVGDQTGCLEPGTTAWTVVWDQTRDLRTGPPARAVRVTAIAGPGEVAGRLEESRDRIQGLGLAFLDPDPAWEWIPRISDLTCIQDPPAGWRADGRSGLAHLLSHTKASNAGVGR